MSIELSAKVKEGRLLFVLLLVHLTLLSIQIESPAGTTLFKRFTLQAGGPVLNASSTAVGGAARLWRGYFWLRGARRENSRLAARLQELELRDAARAQAEAENVRLGRLLALKETLPLETVGARVVGRGPAPDFLSSALFIDRGSEDGIQANAAVLSSDGVLGRTVLVSARNSQVQVITNSDAAVGALVERTRSQGVCNGAGDPLLRLSYVGNSEAIEVNDAVVTSGLDGIFPKGLPLGRVVSSQKGTSVFRVVRVQPAADVARAEEVLVVVNRGREAVRGIQNSELRR